jgi:hypothetical protein
MSLSQLPLIRSLSVWSKVKPVIGATLLFFFPLPTSDVEDEDASPLAESIWAVSHVELGSAIDLALELFPKAELLTPNNTIAGEFKLYDLKMQEDGGLACWGLILDEVVCFPTRITAS